MAKPSKTALFTLTTTPQPAQRVERPQAAGQKRKAEEPLVTPHNDLDSTKSRRVEPASAPPAPAGRSPKSKKTGILSRRRMTSSPFTRINPPSFSAGEAKTGLPFSIDAALAGSVPSYKKPKSKPKSSHRFGSLEFDIHEDSPDDEMANLMEHSTGTLDISDDESSKSAKGDTDNKENIPPLDHSLAAMGFSTNQIPVSRRDMMTDDGRNPLGDLNAEEFYAKGCDASSVIIIPGEGSSNLSDEKIHVTGGISEWATSPAIQGQDGFHGFCDKASSKTKMNHGENQLIARPANHNDDVADIKIWESESAKGENEEVESGIEVDIVN